MSPLARVLLFAFIQSYATVLVQRGIFFYTREELGFGETPNLLLALGMGATYVMGALPSHRAARRFGEKRVLLGAVAAQAAALLGVGLQPVGRALACGSLLFSALNGMMWPIVESYVSAGRTPLESLRAIGRFNLCWSAPVALAVWSAGPILDRLGAGLFLAAAGGMVIALVIALSLGRAPEHLAPEHPERPDPARVRALGALMVSSRSSMVAGYAMLFILAPLLPILLGRLGFAVVAQTALTGCLDAGRVAAFVLLQATHAWRGRRAVLGLAAVLLPSGFLLALLAGQGGLVALGLFVFGAAHGIAYYGSLYYAMVIGNASVESGGAHEGLIGSGFVLGPAAALAGRALGNLWQEPALGMLAGVGPIVLAGAAGGLWPLIRAARQRQGPGGERGAHSVDPLRSRG